MISRNCSKKADKTLGGVHAQQILNGQVHDWYRIIHGYTDHLVSGLIDEFRLRPGHLILDPFCGTGTTLVECKKHGIDSVGIDANPSSVLAAQVKTNWRLKAPRLRALSKELRLHYSTFSRQSRAYTKDPTYSYLEAAGFLKRGWISPEPIRKVISVKRAIHALRTTAVYKRILLLALMAETVSSSSNVKFGPELYCGKAKEDAMVLEGVLRRIQQMASDLELAGNTSCGNVRVLRGDSRSCDVLDKADRFDAVICSPPYPTEHDYTRNARLELALLEYVVDSPSLRLVKRQMIRSHTKNIYSGDDDSAFVADSAEVEAIACVLDVKVAKLKHGFARYYPTVIREYFGGMLRHFKSIKPYLNRGATCAYVVGDQCSYLRVYVPTAKILSGIAEEAGYRVVGIRRWRGRRPTTGVQGIDENVLLLRKR